MSRIPEQIISGMSMNSHAYRHPGGTAVSDETSLKKTFALSILLHLLLLLTMGKVVEGLDEKTIERLLEDERQQEMTFVFVDTPEDAVESPVPQVSPLFSDRNLAASNPTAPADLPMGSPYQEGSSPLPEMSNDPAPPGQPQPIPVQPQESIPENREETPPESVDGGESRQFDAMRELEAMSRLAPPRKEQQYLQPPATEPPGAPSEPERPRFDNRQSRAQYGAGFSLSTYNWNWAPYLKELKKKIESNIYPPPAFYMGLARGRTFLRFKIMPDGTIRDFEVIGYSGHESLRNTSVTAIESSLPLLPLPSDFPEDFLELRVGFYYNEFIN